MKRFILIFSFMFALCSFASAEWENYDDFFFDIAPVYIDNEISYRFVGANDNEVMVVDLTNELDIDGAYYYGQELCIPSSIIVNGTVKPVVGLDKECFVYSDFDKVMLPSSICFIGNRVFNNCSINEIILSEGIRFIGDNCFNGCQNLNTLTLPNSLPCVGNSCFSYNDIKSVNFGTGLISIGNSNFNYCEELRVLFLPEGLNSMGEGNFNYCPKLDKVIIPRYLRFDNCFNECPNISEIVVYDRNPIGFRNSFNQVDKTKCRLVVPEECIEKYRNAEGWKEFNLIGGTLVNVEQTTLECENTETEYFTIEGIKIATPSESGGVKIKVTAEKTEKIF